MSILGQTGSGFTFTVNSTWGDMAAGPFTVPSPGIIVSDIKVNIGNNGTAQNCRLYVWQDSAGLPGTWLIRGSATFGLGGLGLQTQSSLADNGAAGISNHFIPGGTVIWIGAFCSASTEQISAASGGGSGTEIGNTSDGNWSDHGPAGAGQMNAFIDYTLAGIIKVQTGPSGTPVWTVATRVAVQTGPSGTPVWTVASNVAVFNGSSWIPGV